MLLTEVSRQLHINKTKNSDDYAPYNLEKGKNRFYRRLYQKVSHSTSEFNKIDMNKLFSQDTLDLNVIVHGETSDYIVRVSFSNIINNLRQEINNRGGELSRVAVQRALTKSFDTDDVKVRCNCADAVYRLNYWLSLNGAIAGTPETRPSNVTNPNDTKGSGCKHVQSVLSNNQWIQKAAAVVYNYIKYIEAHYKNLYASIIYPALYDKAWEEPIQQDMFEPDQLNPLDLDSDEGDELIDTANKWAKTKSLFKKDNPYRYKKTFDYDNKDNQDDDIPGLRSFNFDAEMSDTY